MAKATQKGKRTPVAAAQKDSDGHKQGTHVDSSSDQHQKNADGRGEDEESSDEEHEDGLDVSKRGLSRLIEALGDDGLTDLDRAQLEALGVHDNGSDGSIEDEDNQEDVENEALEQDSEDDDGVSEGISADDDDDDEEEEEEDESVESDRDIGLVNVPKAKGGSLAESLAKAGLIPQEDLDDEEEEKGHDEDEKDEDHEGVPLDSLTDAQLSALPETVRSRRMYREKINNEEALLRIRDDIALSGKTKGKNKADTLPWVETLLVSFDKSIEEQLAEQGEGASENDLKREVEFYKQALYCATQGRKLAMDANLPFSRPNDYFAEMVKSDEHMEKVRQKLLDERAGIRASEDAKKQRELKKFGKKVQVEKQLERQKSKKDLEEKVKGLKRKRQGGLDGAEADDDFDVQLESAVTGENGSRARAGPDKGSKGKPKMRRDARDAKFGFGGKKKHSKENTRDSTNDFAGYKGGGRKSGGPKAGGGKRGPARRPGKSKRSAGKR